MSTCQVGNCILPIVRVVKGPGPFFDRTMFGNVPGKIFFPRFGFHLHSNLWFLAIGVPFYQIPFSSAALN